MIGLGNNSSREYVLYFEEDDFVIEIVYIEIESPNFFLILFKKVYIYILFIMLNSFKLMMLHILQLSPGIVPIYSLITFQFSVAYSPCTQLKYALPFITQFTYFWRFNTKNVLVGILCMADS